MICLHCDYVRLFQVGKFQFTMTQMMQPGQFSAAKVYVIEIFELIGEKEKKIISRQYFKSNVSVITIRMDFSNSCGTANGITTCVGPRGQAPACNTLIDRLIPK